MLVKLEVFRNSIWRILFYNIYSNTKYYLVTGGKIMSTFIWGKLNKKVVINNYQRKNILVFFSDKKTIYLNVIKKKMRYTLILLVVITK